MLIRLNFRLLILYVLTIGAESGLNAQISTLPASDPCSCNGSVTVSSSLSGNVFYQLLAPDGGVVNSALSSLGSITFNNLCPEAYTITATGNGTFEQEVFYIAGGAVNPGQATSASICSTAGTVQLSGLLSNYVPGGVWRNSSGQVFSGALVMSAALPGYYTYSLTSNGCDVITGVLLDVIQNANPGLSTTYLICDTYVPFFMTDVLAGNADEGGEWFNSSNQEIDGFYDPASMSSALFTYMIDTVAGCGPVFSTLFIVENQTPDPGISNSVFVCYNAVPFDMTGELGGTPDPGGTWFNSSNTPVTGIFDPLTNSPGVYRYHVDGATPCVDQDAFLTITIVSTNPSGADNSISLCSSDPPFNLFSQLGGSPIAGGTWYNSQNQAIGDTFDPGMQPSGIYTYIFPNVGCFPTGANLTISITPLPNAGLDQQIPICENAGTFSLIPGQGATAGGTWSYGGQTINSSVSVPSSGSYNYTYTVTSPECPSDQATVTLAVAAMPSVPPDLSELLCANDSPINLADYYIGVPQLTFSDSNGTAISSLFDPGSQPQGVYTVTNTSGNVCPPVSGTFTITIEQPYSEDMDILASVCETDGMIDLNEYLPGIDPMNGTWTDEDGSAVSNTVSLWEPGNLNYFFITNAGAVCEPNTIWLSVQVDQQPNAGVDGEYIFCTNSSVQSMNSLIPAGADIGGQWYFNNQIYTSDSFDPSSDAGGEYEYIVAENGTCPQDESLVNIEVIPGIVFDAGPDTVVCSGSMPFAIGTELSGAYTYQWTPPLFLSSVADPQPQVTAVNTTSVPLSTVYSVLVSDGICSVEDFIEITVNPLPVLILPTQIEWCEGENTTFSVSGGTTYSWQPISYFSNPQGSDPGFNEDVPGIYEVITTGTNEWGCTDTISSEIIIHPLPQIMLSAPPTEGCTPLEIHLSLDPASTHISSAEWEVGNLSGTGFELQGTLVASDDYTVFIHAISEYGCEILESYDNFITVYPDPVPSFTFDPLHPTTLENIVSIFNHTTGAVSYEWTLDAGNIGGELEPQIALPPENAGIYELCLIAVSDQGCKDTLCRQIELELDQSLFVPNSFSPNNDGVNDVFYPVFRGYDFTEYRLVIYDRWGIEVFATNDAREMWTGNIQGGEYYVQPDVYVWQIRIKDNGSSDINEFRGHVSVIR
ncbi:MAG: gliding motility-associated C-terminal domain-containing protein [Crocinitomicaceae bacterium]|nr:gliding motility-associated C-terminal domain-containing protein [Crocinitomicaceae bacterium]